MIYSDWKFTKLHDKSKRTLERSISTQNITNAKQILNKRKIKCPGFTPLNVPRIKKNNETPKLIRSNSSYVLIYDKLMKGIKCQQDPKSPSIYNFIVKENNKLNEVLLSRARNKNVLPKINLPRREIIFDYSVNINGSPEYFGEKYNPHNFELSNHINRTQRNINGTLFCH